MKENVQKPPKESLRQQLLDGRTTQNVYTKIFKQTNHLHLALVPLQEVKVVEGGNKRTWGHVGLYLKSRSTYGLKDNFRAKLAKLPVCGLCISIDCNMLVDRLHTVLCASLRASEENSLPIAAWYFHYTKDGTRKGSSTQLQYVQGGLGLIPKSTNYETNI